MTTPSSTRTHCPECFRVMRGFPVVICPECDTVSPTAGYAGLAAKRRTQPSPAEKQPKFSFGITAA